MNTARTALTHPALPAGRVLVEGASPNADGTRGEWAMVFSLPSQGEADILLGYLADQPPSGIAYRVVKAATQHPTAEDLDRHYTTAEAAFNSFWPEW